MGPHHVLAQRAQLGTDMEGVLAVVLEARVGVVVPGFVLTVAGLGVHAVMVPTSGSATHAGLARQLGCQGRDCPIRR